MTHRTNLRFKAPVFLMYAPISTVKCTSYFKITYILLCHMVLYHHSYYNSAEEMWMWNHRRNTAGQEMGLRRGNKFYNHSVVALKLGRK
jgi:hypothetical protein